MSPHIFKWKMEGRHSYGETGSDLHKTLFLDNVWPQMMQRKQ